MDINGGNPIQAGGPIQLCGRASVLERADATKEAGAEDQVFNGLMSQLTIFNGPLSASQIAALKQNVGGKHFWPFLLQMPWHAEPNMFAVLMLFEILPELTLLVVFHQKRTM